MSEDAALVPAPLTWTTQLRVASTSSSHNTPLVGDKILLPPSALEQLLAAAPIVTTESNAPHHPYTSTFDPYNPYTFAAERNARAQLQDRQQRLPHPLTFRLVNPRNGRVAYSGIREFSADDGEVVLSQFLSAALGLEGSDAAGDVAMRDGVDEASAPLITIHAKELPKGTFVKLRPLEAGYDPADWKSLLEKHMQATFTTLTNGEVITIPSGRKKEEFRFLVDGFKPESDGVCIVDTDLEVDIEPLNEEQARETLQKIAAKKLRAPGTQQGSSPGGDLDFFNAQTGQVLPGEYVDYQLASWSQTQGLEITLSDVDPNTEVDIFVSPYGPRQRARPRDDEYVFSDSSSAYPRRIRIPPTNDALQDAEAVWVSVFAYPPTGNDANGDEPGHPVPYTLRASPFDLTTTNGKSDTTFPAEHDPDETQCKNCKQWIPKRTLMLHENFCYRNNVLCPHGCGQVFQKRSTEFQEHWHCPHDTFYGTGGLSRTKHDKTFHSEQTCSGCDRTFSSLPELAQHKTTVCPGKLILCQFCHLEVPQEGDPDSPDAQAILSGLTPHELADGARTTECHLCGKIVRLRDMTTHLRHHELQKLSKPPPRVCRNVNCGRTLDGVGKNGDTRVNAAGPDNDIGLCGVCFGPLYVNVHDPDGKALKRRIERRYLTQLLTGCGKAWCKNELCKTGRSHHDGLAAAGSVSSKDALLMARPFLEKMRDKSSPLHFCVDERSQKQRVLAEMVAAEGGHDGLQKYAFEWCIAALDAEGGDLDRARAWLKNWAPESG